MKNSFSSTGFGLCLASLLMLSATSLQAEIKSGSLGEKVTYEWDTETGNVIISGEGAMNDYEWGASPFYNSNIKKATIQDGVTNIGRLVFYGCDLLGSVELSSRVATIETWAFYSCYSLESVTIPEGVECIKSNAFVYCYSLSSIEIPASVRDIEERAFRYNGLTSITVSPDNETYDSRNDCNAIIETATNKLLIGSGYTTIPADVTCIAVNAFSCGTLTSIYIPANVNIIENQAFSGCNNLTSIVVDTNNATYDSRNNCNAIISKATNELITGCRSTVIPTSVTSIGSYAFDYIQGSPMSIVIPESVSIIRGHAFNDCTCLSSIEFSEGITSIEQAAFQSCSSLKSVEIPESCTSIDGWAFNNCRSLTSIKLPSGITSISPWMIAQCAALTHVEIPEGVTSIGDNAFINDHCLTSLVIPASVTSIGKEALCGCYDLSAIYMSDNIPECAISSYAEVPDGCTLYVPVGLKQAYREAEGWKYFANIEEYTDASNLAGTDDVLYLDNLQAGLGKEATLTVELKNKTGFSGFQGDIYLPAGVEFVTDGNGLVEATPNSDRIDSHAFTFEAGLQADGSLRLLAYAPDGSLIEGSEGMVATVKVRVSDDAIAGKVPVLLKNVVLTQVDGKTQKLTHVKSDLSIIAFTLGDANGDKEVNVGDLATTAYYILGNEPARFVLWGADANEDDEINVGDLSRTAAIIMGTYPAHAPKLNEAEGIFSMNLWLEPVAGRSYLLHVGTENPGMAFSGFQFDLTLPESWRVQQDAYGLAEVNLSTLRTDARSTDLFDSNLLADGRLRVLCASSENALFQGESGEVVTLLLEAGDEDFDGLTIALRGITCTTTGESLKAADVELRLADAISSVESLSNTATSTVVYDLSGRVVMQGAHASECLEKLPHGVYVMDGKRVVR